MRKLIVFAALTAMVAAPAALAKERNIALAGKPAATKAGKAASSACRGGLARKPFPDWPPTPYNSRHSSFVMPGPVTLA